MSVNGDPPPPHDLDVANDLTSTEPPGPPGLPEHPPAQPPMVAVSRWMPIAAHRVFDVLADGWSYPLWVVGASHMREVDPEWPRVGSRLHHSVGAWPLAVEDVTEVVGMEPRRRLELAARAWPTGAARIEIRLESHGEATKVTLGEGAESGPATLLPGIVERALLVPRNQEALQRLERIARRDDHRR